MDPIIEKLSPMAISDVACWGDKKICIEVADALQLRGVELMPFRRFDQKLIDSGTLAFHGPLLKGGSESMLTRMRYGSSREIPEVLFWKLLIGSLGSNPALRLARDQEIPLVLHQETILELAGYGQLDRLMGLRLLIENSNFTNHPLIKGDVVGSYFRAIELAQGSAMSVQALIDLEHLAISKWPRPYDLGEFLDSVEQLVPIGEFHVCDSIPGKEWRSHLIPGEGTSNLAEQLGLIGRRFPKALVVLEHKSRMSLLSFILADRRKRYQSILAEAAKAYEFVRSSLNPLEAW